MNDLDRVLEILRRLDVVELAALDEGIEDRGGLRSAFAVVAVIILSAQDNPAQSPFSEVVVDRYAAVAQEASELLPIFEHIVPSFPERRLRKALHFEQVRADLIKERFGASLSFDSFFVGRFFSDLPLDRVDCVFRSNRPVIPEHAGRG